MIRYTLAYTLAAQDSLAAIWLEATDRRAITEAGDEIDRLLSVDPGLQGKELREGLRHLTVQPLRVLFTVEEMDRTVVVWLVKRATEPQL